jgi:hypothetical protein
MVNITNMSYINQANVTAASGSSSIRNLFTNTTSTVVISWGGHIAKGPNVWGDGNSAAAVSGSPYHTRLLSWDPDGDGLNQSSVGKHGSFAVCGCSTRPTSMRTRRPFFFRM